MRHSQSDLPAAASNVSGGEAQKDSSALNKATSAKPVRIQRKMTLIDAIGLLVGTMVGPGIFASPTGVLRFTGSVGLSLLIWVLVGLFTMVGSICFIELGTMIQKSGGVYQYIYEGFGELPAFLYLWVFVIISGPTGNTITALIMANYLLEPIFPNCEEPPQIPLRLLAGAVLCFLTWLNCHGINSVTRFQNSFNLLKFACLLLVIGTGAYYLALGHYQNFKAPFTGSQWSVSSIAVAFYQGSFAFSGWKSTSFIVEELKHPNRDLPRSVWISMPTLTLLFFLINASFFVLMTPQEVLESSAVAVDFGNKVFGEMGWVVSILVALMTFGSINSIMLAVSRMYFAGAREGQLPEFLSLINVKNFLPVPAIMIAGGSASLMLVSSDVVLLINYLTFVDSFFVLLCIASLLWLRYKQPLRKRPVKVWLGFPIIYALFGLFLVILPIIERPFEIGVAIAIILSGIPIYYLSKKWNLMSHRCGGKFTSLVQVLTLSIPQD